MRLRFQLEKYEWEYLKYKMAVKLGMTTWEKIIRENAIKRCNKLKDEMGRGLVDKPSN